MIQFGWGSTRHDYQNTRNIGENLEGGYLSLLPGLKSFTFPHFLPKAPKSLIPLQHLSPKSYHLNQVQMKMTLLGSVLRSQSEDLQTKQTSYLCTILPIFGIGKG